MIAKGFTEPTDRVKRLQDVIVTAFPEVEAERAEIVTEVYKQTENMPNVMRRAKVCEALFNKMPIVIRDDELIVGSLTVHPRSCQIAPEYSYDWVAAEFDTMETRMADPFKIPTDVKQKLQAAFEYWPGKTVSDLATSYMSEETKDCQANGVFTVGNYYYGGVGHVSVDYGKVIQKGFRGVIDEVVCAMQKMDHSDPDYIKKQQFYNAVIITYNAAINFAHRYAQKAREMAAAEGNPTRKSELLQIASNCERVPEHGATNFWEACQSFWFVQMILQLESTGHSISPGRFDTYMYPPYRDDKNITPEFAQELIDCIWVKLNDINKTRDAISDQAFAGYAVFQNLGVGGQDEKGRDITNDISYMAMTASAHVRLPQPSFSIRVHENTPDEFLYRACELARLGLGVPAMYNDEVIIPALVNRGVALEDARNYCIIGCVEPQCPHKTEGWHDAAFFNVAKVMEITMNNGRVGDKQLGPVTGEMSSWTNIEDFFDAFKKQMEYFVYHLAEADNSVDLAHMERDQLPFLSALVEDCIGRGKTVEEGGAIYNFTGPQAFGVVDAGDSAYAMQKHVFENKEVSIAQLKEALDNNFGYPVDSSTQAEKEFDAKRAGGGANISVGAAPGQTDEQKVYEIVKKILSTNGSADLATVTNAVNSAAPSAPVNGGDFFAIKKLMEKTDCYGNDIDEVDYVSARVARIYSAEVEKHTNPRGGQFQAGCYPVSANVLFGKDVAALPDGRLATTPLADGVSPRAGKDVSGPTAATNSVAKLDHEYFSNGTLYNQKFTPSAVAGDEGLKNFAAVVRSYFDHKGMHVQFNVIDRQTLLDAQEHPELHKDLVVRVAGYSAHFVTLAKEVQDNIIERTEHEFGGGGC